MDKEKLIEFITKEVMKLLNEEKQKKVLIITDDENPSIASSLKDEYIVEISKYETNLQDYEFVIYQKEKLIKKEPETIQKEEIVEETQVPDCSKILDLLTIKILQEKDLREVYSKDIKTIKISTKTIITPLAKDFIKSKKLKILKE